MTKSKKQYLSYILMFAAYMFLHTTTLYLGNGNGVLSKSQQEMSYYIHQIIIVLGFVSFAPLERIICNDRGRKAVTLCAFGLYTAGMATVFTLQTEFAYTYIIPVAIFCIGFLGGLVYYEMSQAMTGNIRIGLVMGIGSGLAYALQYPLELLNGISPVLPVVMLLAAAGLVTVLFRRKDISGYGVEGNYSTGIKNPIVCACIISAVLIMFASFYDGYILKLQISFGYVDYSAYSWPRLVLVPAYLVFGLIGDIKRGKYLPLAVLCAALVTLLNSVLAKYDAAYWVNMCLFYVSVAAAISYYNLTFWRLAPKTKHPKLWASMGRIIDGIVGVTLGLINFSNNSVFVILGADIVCLAAIIVVMALNGDFNLLTPQTTPANEPAPSKSEEELLEAIKTRYSLTPAELKVFRELVLTEDKQAAIGEHLSIKVSTVQFHTTSIYRKTGAQTRVGLSEIYRRAMDE